MISKIVLENIKIYAYHGVLPQETIIGTCYIVNTELQADITKAAYSDDLNDTINYAEVSQIIHDEMAIPSQLLERVIGRILTKLENQFPQLVSAKIRLTKTRPPMPGEMDGVSIEMEKYF